MLEGTSSSTEDGIGQSHFDVTVVGTGLSESIAASTLAKQGLSVLHLDEHEYYGDRHASLTVDEMMQWVEEVQSSPSTRYSNASYEFPSDQFKDDLPRIARQYALSLFPTVLPARGDLIETLIEEDVGKYVNFRLVDGVAIFQTTGDGESSPNGTWKRVPAGKDQIFKDSSLSLLEKRRLMKFIMFASSEKGFSLSEDIDPLLRGKESQPIIDYLKGTFQLSDTLAKTIAYGIAFCSSPSDPAAPALIKMNRYFRSIGRYGPSPFLVAQYGGIGEITQAFCRACAVHGGTYILGAQSKITNLQLHPTESEGSDSHPVSFRIPAHPTSITTDLLISGSQLAHPSTAKGVSDGTSRTRSKQANCVAVLNGIPPSIKAAFEHSSGTDDAEEESNGIDATETTQDVLLLVFPPGSAEGTTTTAVRALLMGHGTGSCPSGQFILYIQASMEDTRNPKVTLLPYVTRLLGEHAAEFISFYTSTETETPSVLPQGSQDQSPDIESQQTIHVEPAMCEGLDLESRRAKDIIQRGLSALPQRLRDKMAQKEEVHVDV